ncbi:hypothetical protein CK936_01345 [Streptomyces albireticuli]|uniref:Uncharacterized protein n=1 Tax=Streptomyces albireticuli TaxID=1940 RepID=A0A2A2DGP2_9ACTN|nr:hypothetical protein CK936_01345 [Streptomyces albireticuli]
MWRGDDLAPGLGAESLVPTSARTPTQGPVPRRSMIPDSPAWLVSGQLPGRVSPQNSSLPTVSVRTMVFTAFSLLLPELKRSRPAVP